MAKRKERSKKHHFVPQCLQQWFCNAAGEIWYAEKSPNGFVIPKNNPRTPNGCFWERNLNTIITADGLSDALEKTTWEDIDQGLAKFLNQAHRILDNKKSPDITNESLQILRYLVAMLMTRSPEIAPSLESLENKFSSGLITLAKQAGRLTADLQAKAENQTYLRQSARHIRATALALVPEMTLQEMQNFFPSWGFTVGKSSFILGSKMVYRTGNGGPNGVLNPNCEIWFPVSPKRVLILTRDRAAQGRVHYLGRDKVRHWNQYIVRSSGRAIASHSQELLKSLLNPR